MLAPIDTWTSRSLQFQPPATQPFGVSAHPFSRRITRTTTPAAEATNQAGRYSRSARLASAMVGRASGASQRERTIANPTPKSASTTALTMTAGRPNPITLATTSTRWADTYVLVTTATPSEPGGDSWGATRRTTIQPGTTNRIGHTRISDET